MDDKGTFVAQQSPRSGSSSEETLVRRGQKSSAFRTQDLASDVDFYKPIATYEGAHRYDPEFEWEEAEERRLVRLLDWRICAWVCLMLDRGNIVQAVSDNMLDDLGMNTNDYNTGQTIFYLTFLAAELPSQLISKKLGPDRWIPIQMVSWSLVASCQAFLTGKGSYLATRALLGLIEGGFIPDTILYLTYWYTSKELPTRLSFFWTAYQFTYIVSAFLAFGLLHMAGINGLAGWRWLFALEGTLTGLIGVVTAFYIPPSPTQTKGLLRGKNGWFTEREEKIMVNRVLRDDPSKGDMHNRQGVDWPMFGKCLMDFDMWPIYLLGLSWMIITTPQTAYITLLLKSSGFNTFTTNLLTIPAYSLFIINLLFWTWVSRKVNSKFLVGLASQLWVFPCLVALAVLPDDASRWVRYVLLTLCIGYPYVHAIVVAVTSRNAGSVRTRTVATALYNMFVQASNIIGNNIYRDGDKPYYRVGNRVLLGILSWNVCLFIACHFYYRWRNQQKARQWDAMSSAEKTEYLATTKDEGNKRLDFRFEY